MKKLVTKTRKTGLLPKFDLKMKLSALLLLISIFTLQANETYSQRTKVTLDFEDIKVERLLDEIQDNTEFKFVYKTGEIDLDRTVSVKVKNAHITKILDEVFANTSTTYRVIDRQIFLNRNNDKDSNKGSSQLYINGRVIDSIGMPIPGVSVMVKGESRGTSTDINGNYRIDASPADILVFTFIGYQSREVEVTNQERIDIVLFLEISLLDEVVLNTGYQTINRNQATGSFVQIGNDLVNRNVSTNILERLEDVTSGLIFNRNAPVEDAISIRGRSTIFANSQPLIIVDDFPYEGDIININPNDVESITILKDAAAASIWGARAGNGVIVITTKKGSYNQDLQVSLNSNISIGEKFDAFYTPQMETSDFIEVERMLFDRGYYAFAETSPANSPLTPVVELLIAQRDGEISLQELNQRIEELGQNDIRREYEEHFYRGSINKQYAINLRGGSLNQKYLLSAGYDHNAENLVENQFERLTVGANHTISLLKNKLEFTSGINLVKTRDQNNGINPNSFRMDTENPMYPYARLADDSGNPLPITYDYRERFVNGIENEGLLNWQYRPLEEIGLSDNISNLTDLRLNAKISYKFFDQLKAEILYQYWESQLGNRFLRPQESYFTRNLINTYTQVSETGNLNYAVPLGGILDVGNLKSKSHSVRGQLTYDGALADNHWLSAVAGYEVRDLNGESTNYRYYGYNDDLGVSVPVDYTNFYSRYYFPLFTSQIPENDGITGITDRFISYYGNVAYTLNNKYNFSLSGRRDLSNLFGVATNQKGIPLWSTGVGWNIHKESFYNFDLIPYLKIRASYGYNGNIDKGVSAYTTARIAGTYFVTGLPYAQITNPPNPELRWERVKIMNLGLDFEIGRGILSGTVEYYTKKGIDLIGDTPYPPSSGVTSFRGNRANTFGEGVDLSLNSININKGFKWQTNFLFSYINEKVTKYEDEGSTSNYLTFGSGEMGLSLPLEGKPLYSIYSYEWAGLNPETGAPQGIFEGEISTDYLGILNASTPQNIIYHGSARPTTFGAIRNTFSYKDFSLSANISYRLGYYFRRNSIRYSSVLNAQGGHSDYSIRWQNPGDESFTSVPSMPANIDARRDNFYSYSEVLVEKGDHIRLQDIKLSYNLSKTRFPGLPFENLNLYTYANNLGILWKETDAVDDPDFRTVRPLKTFSLGIRMDF